MLNEVSNYLRHVALRDVTMPNLTKREIDCLQWAALGKSSQDIAAILGLSTRGIEFHFESARKKLDAANRTQAVAIAVSIGIINLPDKRDLKLR